MADMIGVKLTPVVTPSLLKKVMTFDGRMRNQKVVTSVIQPFSLGQHTTTQRKIASTAAYWYSTVVGGGAAPLLANADILSDPDGVSLPATFLQARVQMTWTQVIYVCMFGMNDAVVGKLADFVSRMQEEEHMLLDYVLHNAKLRLHIPPLLACWIQIRFSNWLDEQWADRDVVSLPTSSTNYGFI